MNPDTDSFFLSNPDAMWVYDLETLYFLAVNEAAVAKYGYTREEFLAMKIADIRPEEDAPALTANIAGATQGCDEAGVWRHLLKSGGIVYVTITGHTIDYAGRRAELITVRDVTKSIESARALERANRMLEIAGSSAKFGGWRYDVLADEIEWSPETARIHGEPDGFSPELPNAISYYIPEHQDTITALLRACVDHGQPFDVTLQIITVRGRRIWVRATGEAERNHDGHIIVIHGSIQDVTELKALRRRAEESEHLLAIAGQAVKLGGWRVDLATEKVSWTDGTAVIHELPAGTVPTLRGGINYFAPEEQESAKKVFEDCAELGIPFNNIRDLITAKGHRIQVRSIGEAVRDDSGKIVAVQGAMQDITELTAAQRKVDELDQRLVETLESIGDAFYTIDRNWRFSYLNNKAEDLLKRKRDELIGRGVVDEFPEIAGSVFELEYARALDTGETVRFEQYYAPLGRTFSVSAHPTPNGLAVYFADITVERLQTEKLRLLQAAAEKINDIIVITDALKRDESGYPTIIYVNNAFERITEYTREEVSDLTPSILQGPRTDKSELARIRKALETNSPVRAELIYYTKSGCEYWLELDIVPLANADGLVTHFVAVHRDITDRRRADEELRISEARFRLIAEASGNAAWDWDIAQGRLWWSDGMERQFGHLPKGNLPTVWRDHVHPDDARRVQDTIDALLAGKIETAHYQYRFQRADGSWADAESHAIALRDATGRAIRVLGSMSDISHRQEMEERLRRSQKLEAIGQLTGGVAHDFNNLLTIIMGNTEMLQDNLDEGSPLRRFADMSALAADRGAELTNRLLAFSRQQALQPKIIDINAVIDDIQNMLRRTLGEDIDIKLVRADGLWPTEIDQAQVDSALLNLAINSRDAMPDGGSLTIETANAVLDDTDVAIDPDLAAGHYVIIAVSDTGHGIPKDQIARVFEPFFTTKAPSHGTGLGLSMVYGFVKQTGGHIRIYSEPNEGTTVKLYFPRYLGDNRAHDIDTFDKPLQGGEETILVVEDEGLILQQLTAQLIGLGYEVITASAGPSALEALHGRSDVDLLLTDVVLPGGMNGRQIAEAAQLMRPDLKVLYTSGYSEDAIIHHGRLDPGVNFLSKPYRRSELATKVREVLDS